MTNASIAPVEEERVEQEPAEQDPIEQGNGDDIEGVELSALLSSRVCHDLINPVGAISSGLSMIDDPSSDEAMKEMADELVRDGTRKALALLSYARLAYGAAGGHGAEIKLEDAHDVLKGLYDTSKAVLDWRMPDEMMPKNKVKILLVLGHAAVEASPRGGEVIVSPTDHGFKFEVTGKRLFLNEDLKTAFSGNATDLKPKFTPAYIVSILARESQGVVKANLQDEQILMTAEFG